MKKVPIVVGGVLLTGLILSGCGASEQELGDGYYYLPHYEAVDVGYSGGATIYQSNQRYVFNTVLVQGGVVEVQKDNHFIIAARNTKWEPRTGESVAGAAAKELLQYYIIVKTTGTVYGPLDKEAYARKREAIGVPEGLELQGK